MRYTGKAYTNRHYKRPMNMNDIIQRDAELTEIIDEQIPKSHIHKFITAETFETKVEMCECGAVKDEHGENLS